MPEVVEDSSEVADSVEDSSEVVDSSVEELSDSVVDSEDSGTVALLSSPGIVCLGCRPRKCDSGNLSRNSDLCSTPTSSQGCHNLINGECDSS